MMDKASIGLGSNQFYQSKTAPATSRTKTLSATRIASDSGNANSAAAPQTGLGSGKKVLKMVKNERMGGSVPVWESPKTAQQNVEQTLSTAYLEEGSFKQAMAYASQEQDQIQDEEFGFGDLIDMVNPLQHIPVVSLAYREITGDEIKPISKIIGGGLFGGPAGAAMGVVDAAIEEETGKDLAGNALGLVIDGEAPRLKQLSEDPERRLNEAVRQSEELLPANLLAFADTRRQSDITIGKISIERIPADEKPRAFRFQNAEVSEQDRRQIVRNAMRNLPERDEISGISIKRLRPSES